MRNTAEMTVSSTNDNKGWNLRPTQEGVVFLLTVVLFAIFSVTLSGFLSAGNVITLMRSVSILGMLALGMAIVVVGRGVDLSMVASMVVGMCWALKISNDGVMNFQAALLVGLAFVIFCGLVTGVIVAFAEIPAVFTTLAMGAVIFGFGNSIFFSTDTHNAPQNLFWLREIGYGSLYGVPYVIYIFCALAIGIHLVLKHTRFGRIIYVLGDNPNAARLTGFPVRPLLVAKYITSSVIAYIVAIIVVASNSGMNTRLFYTPLVYDVLLVVVLGGIGLSGGRGGARSAWWAQLLADTFDVSLTTHVGGETGAALGAARLGWLASGASEEFVCQVPDVAQHFVPQAPYQSMLWQRHARFQALYPALHGL